MEIPTGLGELEEWQAIRRIQGREVKPVLVDWLLSLATWETRADLTFESLAGPDRAQRAVHAWLRKVAPDHLAVVGYERQERGAVHCHVVIARRLCLGPAIALWNQRCGFCRIEFVESQAGAVDYAVKHAAKALDIEIIDYPSAQPRLC
jgi:hypothetical protein